MATDEVAVRPPESVAAKVIVCEPGLSLLNVTSGPFPM
jgi:hypothetical protein